MNFQDMIVKYRPELDRLNKVAKNLEGARKLVQVYENHFQTKFIDMHLNDVMAAIAKVNILRESEGMEILI